MARTATARRPVNPNLAGQHAEYITLQLTHFQAGIRVNPVMQGMAATLKPEDMKALGIYFSQQKPKGLAAKDAALVTAGQKLYRGGDSSIGMPACAACHSPNGAGVPKNYPRLAGQYADYTYAQLKAFRTGERGADKEGKDTNGKIMATIAARMTETADEGARRVHVRIALSPASSAQGSARRPSASPSAPPGSRRSARARRASPAARTRTSPRSASSPARRRRAGAPASDIRRS